LAFLAIILLLADVSPSYSSWLPQGKCYNTCVAKNSTQQPSHGDFPNLFSKSSCTHG